MKTFMGKNFLLRTETAKKLYHKTAADLPIIDYHCHINPQEIYEDRKFKNITEAWLGGDHYKWRIMRANGVDEQYVTGDAPDREKFQKYAESLEKAIGNPLYHWSHLELKRYFNYDGVLNGETAEAVWTLCNERLQDDCMSVRNIIRRSNVEVICTTDDPADTLEWHQKIAEDPEIEFKVYPAWRPDQAVNIEKDAFIAYLQKLSAAAETEITDYESLIQALEKRMDFFDAMGCCVSDHGIDYVPFIQTSEKIADKVFQKKLSGGKLNETEIEQYKTAFLLDMGRLYARHGWVMQLHYSCKRNNNSLMFEKLGPDTGYDAMRSGAPAEKLADFLNELNRTDELPKTVIYSLNPNDNAVIDSIIGCFQDGTCAGKVQHGAAWWFNDHKAGMTEQMVSLANIGVLGNFIGMLTDSRSFLSYARHEYFRRILCDLIGDWVENGEYPDDEKTLKKIVRGISYENAKQYFDFK